MKLYAVKHKSAGIISAIESDGSATMVCALYETAKLVGGDVIELHTYDPATQVVVGIDVYEHMCAFTRAVIKQLENYEGEPVKPVIEKFLSAGKEAT